MRIRVGRPRNLWNTDSDEFSEHRRVYGNLLDVLLSRNYEFEVYDHRPGIETVLDLAALDGPVYSYHAENPGPNQYCLKRGPLPYLWHMNSGGYSGWCSLARDTDLQACGGSYSHEQAMEIIEAFRSRLLSGNYALIPQPEAVLEAEIASLEGFVFYPLQVNNDEVMKLSEISQFELIAAIGAAADRLKRHVVLKRHPLCESRTVESAIERIRSSEFVHMSRGPTTMLIERSRAVVLTNSSVGVQSLIFDIPVFSTGGSEFAHMTHGLDDISQIDRVFLDLPPRPHDAHAGALAYLLNDYLVDMTDPDRIAARIAEHAADTTCHVGEAREDDDTAKRRLAEEDTRSLSLRRALEKDSRELLDFQLACYGDLHGDAKLRAVRLLSRLVWSGHFVERIIRYTDAAVANRSLRYLERRNDLVGAERVARAMLSKTPDNSWALYVISKALYARGHEGQGLDYAEHAAQSEGATSAIVLFYARKLLKIRKVFDIDMRHLVDRALAYDAENARGLWLKSQILLEDGDVEGAERNIDAALAREPRNRDFSNLRSRIIRDRT